MKLKLDTFRIEQPGTTPTGVTPYQDIQARNFRVTRQGTLILYSWPWHKEAAFPHGLWGPGVVRLTDEGEK